MFRTKDKYTVSRISITDSGSSPRIPKTVGSGYQNGTNGWGERHTFLLLGFFGFVICYALRFNLSIAIVAMAKHPSLSTSNSASNAPYNDTLITHDNNTTVLVQGFSDSNRALCSGTIDDIPLHIVRHKRKMEQNTNKLDISNDNPSNGGTFIWSDQQQGLILGSFFWGYVITQFPGGRLSDKYGAKWIFSIGILITGILSLLTPIITQKFNAPGLIVLRVLQGLAEGVTLPSILVMLAHWSPFHERSTMTNWIYVGIPIGTFSVMVAGGHLIHYMGWPSLFYLCGVVTIIWFVFWCFLAYDDPSEHPRISHEELSYIQSHLKGETLQKDVSTPWRSILRSMPVWSIFIADLGDSWSHYLLHVEVPIYLTSVHGFDIEASGWFSALPQALQCVFAILVSYISDLVIMRQMTSVIATRKVCSAIALWGSAAGFVGMILGGCNTMIAVCSLNFAAMISGASNSGWTVNTLEIAPTHAGSISGAANSIGNCLGFVAPYVTGLILDSIPSLKGWKIALTIPAVINFFVMIFYYTFASADEQTWSRQQDDYRKDKDTKTKSIESPS